ncbi:MAG TPA: VanW family protein [Methylomirabilota bacterium]|nr:VanW family protein [Methylomirabilota bacterium]
MSLSKILKISFASGIFLFIPFLVQAKTLVFGDQKWDLSPKPGAYLISPFIRNDFSLIDQVQSAILGTQVNNSAQSLDEASLQTLDTLSQTINQKPENAALTVKDNFATNFNPGQNGQILDLYQLIKKLQTGMVTINLPVLVSEPDVKLADTNNFGIKELVAVGESNFTGSPHNRIININVGAGKYNGLIVKQGEEFSFNKYLGDVDGEHGFLPELVIKPEGVIPEFGGGLCQVSTTTFRAAMNAGLPITARRNHSFAVQYYSPQGTDATIYPGASDLKFINNLPSDMLIRTRIEGHKLYFEFYGTKDTRTVAFDGPTVYDKKPDGSMKATWIRHVTLNDQTVTQTFNSTYLPPALFHHDAVEQASTPNPQAQPATPETTPSNQTQ